MYASVLAAYSERICLKTMKTIMLQSTEEGYTAIVIDLMGVCLLP